MTYKFKFKRNWFWQSFVVMGHGYDDKQDKMVLYFKDGTIRELKHWKDCEISLGLDWKLAQQKMMEDKAGQSIPLKV